MCESSGTELSSSLQLGGFNFALLSKRYDDELEELQDP